MRFFQNNMQDFVPGSRVTVDEEHWKSVTLSVAKEVNAKMPPTFDSCDGGLYVGCAGVAYMYYYLAHAESFADIKQELLIKARNYTDVALSYTETKQNRDPPAAFLLGGAGAFAVGSLVYDVLDQKQASDELKQQYLALSTMLQPVHALGHGSDELFVGRAGYLCGTLLLNRTFGQVINKDAINSICKSIIHSGREYSKQHKSRSPLMYAYYNTEYLGAAHGLSSILQMLLCFPDFYKSESDAEADIRGSVDFLLGLTQPNGNVAPAVDEAEGHTRRPASEEMIHWCHGAPGVVYLFAKAFLTWKDPRYLQACLKCGEITWQKGLLRKGPGICHGVAGSGYVFLLLYRLTSDEQHLHRAAKFAEFLLSAEFKQGARTPDTPHSLYEGLAGTACFLADLLQPHRAEFPFFDVFQ